MTVNGSYICYDIITDSVFESNDRIQRGVRRTPEK